MDEKGLRKLWGDDWISKAALIEITGSSVDMSRYDIGERGVAVDVGENLSPTFLSGDIIVFWGDGEHTCLDGLEFDVVVENLFERPEGRPEAPAGYVEGVDPSKIRLGE